MNRIGDTDMEVFPLALGTSSFGWTSDESVSIEVLDAYVAAGGNFIDTADGYSAWVQGNRGGESESIIGDWMAARKNRDRIVVGTKVGRHPQFPGMSAANIRAAADASLRRLRTDRIDVYHAHLTTRAFLSRRPRERSTRWSGTAKCVSSAYRTTAPGGSGSGCGSRGPTDTRRRW
jgi:aryl-alcohol dehydrogenase-like predicted oxidoreductase